MPGAVLGVDIGTSSSKGVIVDLTGVVLATAVREHRVSRPRPGWVEMDAEVWWDEFVSITTELIAAATTDTVLAVGVSGMGPCVLMTDAACTPLHSAILYGVDTRATVQINRLNESLGEAEILERCGSALSSQAAGPKLSWLADNEPEVFAKARRLFMPNSWLAWKLTGSYVLDHESASQCTPLYDTVENGWHTPWGQLIAPDIELPPLV